jgi:cytochrome b subunit of formate dehydrogenase
MFFLLLSIVVYTAAIAFAIVAISAIPMFMFFGAFFLMVEWLVTKIFGPVVCRIIDQLLYLKSEESKEERRGRWD